jgi:hypothetical protein
LKKRKCRFKEEQLKGEPEIKIWNPECYYNFFGAVNLENIVTYVC